jgi:hypothetical protein
MENKVGFLLQKSFVCVEIIFSGLKNANYLPPKKNTDTKGCISTSKLLFAIGEILQNEIQIQKFKMKWFSKVHVLN